MAKKTGYYIDYDFEHKGHEDKYYDYELSFEEVMKGIRKYFDNQIVTLDGTDTAVWNALVVLGDDIIDNILDEVMDYLKEECKDNAYEEYKEYVDWYYDEDDVSDDDPWR